MSWRLLLIGSSPQILYQPLETRECKKCMGNSNIVKDPPSVHPSHKRITPKNIKCNRYHLSKRLQRQQDCIGHEATPLLSPPAISSESSIPQERLLGQDRNCCPGRGYVPGKTPGDGSSALFGRTLMSQLTWMDRVSVRVTPICISFVEKKRTCCASHHKSDSWSAIRGYQRNKE